MPKLHPEATDTVPIEWSTLSQALTVLMISLVMVGLLIGGSYQYRNQMDYWLRQQRNDFNKIETDYSHIQEALEIVDNLYLDKFYQLEKEGFFLNRANLNIEEPHLKMFNEIKALLALVHPFSANYELSSKKNYQIPDLTVEDQFKTYETQLILKLTLLHEGDMLDLIKAIEIHQFTGLFNLQKCDIKQLNKIIDVKDVSKAYLEVTCTLNWYISHIETMGE
jgi:hypothetical protein